MNSDEYHLVSRSDMEPMMSDGLLYKQPLCNRRSIILSFFLCVVCLVLGVVIGWFSHKSQASASLPAAAAASQSFDVADYIVKNLNKDNIKTNLQEYSEEPRLPGLALDKELAEKILNQWKSFGLDEVHFAPYDVLLSFPNSSIPNKVQILNSNNQAEFTSASVEEPLTPAENKSGVVPPFNAFAPAGVAVGDLIYINYGRVEDFQYLTLNLSMNLTGKILIARYGKIFRGDKAKLAAEHKASGLILYNDPVDFNSDPKTEPYPHSWWLPPTGLQRGTVGTDGDYQTPLYPSTDYAYKIPISELKDLPKVPTQPIGYGDAEKLLRKTRVEVNNFLHAHTAYNIIGYIHGAVEPDRYVLMGNHHDAWAFGAIDPFSGSAALTDIVRVFGQMLQQGHRPRRTVVFCSWDAEEPGLEGSTEFVEDKMKVLYERAVAYVNVDYAVDYPYTLQVGTSPLLQDALYAAARKVPSPEKDGGTLFDLWRTRPVDSSQPVPPEPEVYYSLGSGSDMATFYQRAGVPCVDMWFSYDQHRFDVLSYPIYHSAYETFFAYTQFIDPNFNYTLSMAQFWAVLVSDLANEELLNMNIMRYSAVIEKYLESMLTEFESLWQEKGIISNSFISAVHNFTKSAEDFAEELKNKNSTGMQPLELRMLNDRLLQLERAFIDPEGLPGRPQYKHVMFAPSRFDAYSDNSFPGIVDTMYDLQHNKTSDWSLLKKQIYIATYMIQSAANTLNGIGL